MVDGQVLLDLSYEEDSRADVDMNFVMTGNNQMVEIQSTGEDAPFTIEQFQQMLELAQKGITELTALQRQALGL